MSAKGWSTRWWGWTDCSLASLSPVGHWLDFPSSAGWIWTFVKYFLTLSLCLLSVGRWCYNICSQILFSTAAIGFACRTLGFESGMPLAFSGSNYSETRWDLSRSLDFDQAMKAHFKWILDFQG